ncbi:porphobilinogen synthase [uncultured Planktomarina sp.]|uniref:porphobilinogen synthase n=1 Tax=uncultured Planktomarina sp. TaxID=1538529 RepID=UPI003260D4F8|tara:strand:- start:11435 stop:12445 length:1011 start_codon:yes stop_codon:yes gene_type:complete
MARSQNHASFPAYRPRRLRAQPALRDMVRENTLTPADLIWPVFVMDGQDDAHPIASMPGVSRHTVDRLPALAAKARSLGIPAICIFPYTNPAFKTQDCAEAWNPDNLSNRAIKAIKSAVPDIMVMTDIALDPYNINGQDGIVRAGEIVNDETVAALVKMGESQAQSGADILGPSDMMDGRIAALRGMLEQKGFQNVNILSYSAKYASGFYGPFRDAVGAASVLIGDKNTYQMDPANSNEAMRMIARDLSEGADLVMVKPGMPYLDICQRAKAEFQVPTFAYQVSGEYAMLKAAAQNGWLDGRQVMLESLMAFKRAGCDGVLTYFAPEVAEILLRKL